MLNTSQVARIREQLAAGHRAETIDGLHLATGTVRLPERAPGEIIASRAAEAGAFYGPDIVLGTPGNPSCLHGIADMPITVARHELRRVEAARVVGSAAVMTAEGCLFQMAPLLRGASFVDAIDRNTRAYPTNCVLHEAGGDLLCTHASRIVPRSIDAHALFLHNVESANYGAFLYRQLPQLLFALRAGVPFDCYITPIRTPFLMEALRLAGAPVRPVLSVREVCGELFRSVSFCNDIDTEGFLSPHYLADLDRLAKAAAREAAVPDRGRKLYVSRSLIGVYAASYRRLENDDALEDAARRRGFAIVQAEALPLGNQVQLFARATHIVGPSGSGMGNAIFAPPGGRVLDMESFATTVRQHAKVYASGGKRYGFLFGIMAADEAARREDYRRWTVPPALFESGLDWLEQERPLSG